MNKELKLVVPKSINIQVVDENSEDLRLKNILCHLNIFNNDNSWFTYSFIPTNINGQVRLSREEIINNTELKHQKNLQNEPKLKPTKFEFFVIDNDILSVMLKNTKLFLSQTDEDVIKELESHLKNETAINNELRKIKQKQIEDEVFYKLLKSNENSNLIFSPNKSKIRGEWEEEIDYEYKLKLKK